VTEVEQDASDYRNIHKLISHESMPVDCFTCAYSDLLQLGEAIFVDDEGLFKQPDRFFKFAGYEQPLAGKGLILGSDTNGETKGATSKLATIMASVMFAERMGNELIQTNKPWVREEQ
jgi:hypothetical protein